MKKTKNNWMKNIVEEYLCSLLFDNNPDVDMKEEYEKIEKVCRKIVEDEDLERQIKELIGESAEWYYYHLD